MKNGPTSSQHTWAYRTHSTQGCLRLAEAAVQQVTEAHLRQAATTLEEADAWVQLDQSLRFQSLHGSVRLPPLGQGDPGNITSARLGNMVLPRG
jgi:hypothetical protein